MITGRGFKHTGLLALLFVCCVIQALCGHVWGEKLYFDINSPFMRRIPVAILPFDNGGNLENGIVSKKVASILENDLEAQGFFSVSDQTDYDRLLDSDWQQSGIEYVIKGRTRRQADDIVVELVLLDSASGKMKTGRRYKGSASSLRVIAHRFCDLVVKEITGTYGTSLTRLYYVKRTGSGKAVFSSDFIGLDERREVFDHSINLSPALSPDGRHLAYISFATGRPGLYVREMRGSRTGRLIAGKGLNISPAWHPDGHGLAVAMSSDDNPQIYLVDLSGHVLKRLAGGPGINVSPSWSPDGRRIAFVSDRFGSPQIFIADPGNGHVERLTYRGNYNTEPCWSPDGSRIVYTGRTEGRFQIFVITLSDRRVVQLTFEGSNEHPSWSPDSRHIVFISTRYGGRKIMTMLSNGAEQHVLPVSGEDIGMPFWGPRVME